MAHALPPYVNNESPHVWQMPEQDLQALLSTTLSRSESNPDVADEFIPPWPFSEELIVIYPGGCIVHGGVSDCWSDTPELVPVFTIRFGVCVWPGLDVPNGANMSSLLSVEEGLYSIPGDARWGTCWASGDQELTFPGFAITLPVPRENLIGPLPEQVTVMAVVYLDTQAHPNVDMAAVALWRGEGLVWGDGALTVTVDPIIMYDNITWEVFLPILNRQNSALSADMHSFKVPEEVKDKLHNQYLPLIPSGSEGSNPLQKSVDRQSYRGPKPAKPQQTKHSTAGMYDKHKNRFS